MLFSQQQMRMKTSIPPHLNPLPLGERKAREMGEGEDEGEFYRIESVVKIGKN
jgi:hypothetical protein